MFLFCHWGGKKKTNLLEWPGFFSLTFISLLYLFSVSNTKSKLNSKWVEKASAWLQQHLITLKKSVATNSIGVEYLVDYVVFVRHIVKSESTQKAKEDEIPNLSVSISAFLCSYSFIPFCNLPTTSLWRVSFISHGTELSHQVMFTHYLFDDSILSHFLSFIWPIRILSATWPWKKKHTYSRHFIQFGLNCKCLGWPCPVFHAVIK